MVANWNGRYHLAECLPTMLATRYADFRLTAPDDGLANGLPAWLAANYLAAEVMVPYKDTRGDLDWLAVLYNRAAAFVYAPIREPWGLAAVEAMACGTPVIAVAEGGVAESVADGESGLLTPRDEDAFASALARVLADPALARRLGAGGVARAHGHFTWERTVDRLEAHFEELVRGGASS